MAKQSAADRAKRLDRGACPIHGIQMTPVSDVLNGVLYIAEKAPPLGVPMTETEMHRAMNLRMVYIIVECMRNDCDVRGQKLASDERAGYDGPVDLLPEWEYLLAGE